MESYTINTKEETYPLELRDNAFFNKYDAGNELIKQINSFYPNIINFSTISTRTGTGMKEKLLECTFNIEDSSEHPFYIYAFQIEGGGRSKLPHEQRIQIRDHSKWTPDLSLSPIANNFINATTNKDNVECYVIGIYKTSFQDDDVIFSGFYPNIMTDLELTATSPSSKQLSIKKIREAFLNNVSYQDKGTPNNPFIIINFKPQYILWYMANRDILHLGDIKSIQRKCGEIAKIRTKGTNIIYYGAPGTGKSYKINKVSKSYSVIRTTFHPDSDYSTFVGSYKPTMSKIRKSVIVGEVEKEVNTAEGHEYESRIQYSFVKQAFLKAYLSAWKKYTEAETSENGEKKIQPQYLVIEEINRGNCAQIFGDLFQLLDRQENNGFSCYPIEADADLQNEIKDAFLNQEDYRLVNPICVNNAIVDYKSNNKHKDGSLYSLSEDIQSGKILLLPCNMYIWATMNTSDQSLFPIDSAFKRRWSWEYVRITEGRDKDTHKPLLYSFNVNGTEYDWWSFVKAINKRIGSITSSEDKKLGYFFCGTENGKISASKFVGKVCFYLWSDVFKDFGFGKKDQSAAFKKDDGENIAFDDFYEEDPITFKTKVNEKLLESFIMKLGVETVEQRKRKEEQN